MRRNLPAWAGATLAYLALQGIGSLATAQELPDLDVSQSARISAKIVDVGAGLCTVMKFENSQGDTGVMIYDAGGQNPSQTHCYNTISNKIGKGTKVDLMVISHGDAVHLSNADEVLNNHTVKKLYRVGRRKPTGAWDNFDNAVQGKNVETVAVCSNPLLARSIFTEEIAGATVTLVTNGCCDDYNKNSIMARVDLGEISMLFTGDAEQETIENAANVGFALVADVLIAPHHGGADTGSLAERFIGAQADQQYVIFSSGNRHGHPRKKTVDSYIKQGIALKHIFRTDLGEELENKKEWGFCAGEGEDSSGNNHIQIFWTEKDSSPNVAYKAKGSRIKHADCLSDQREIR